MKLTAKLFGKPYENVDVGRAREHIVVVCKSGGRSSAAARVLSEQGHTVFNVKGGMGAWERAGHRVVARGGGPGRVR